MKLLAQIKAATTPCSCRFLLRRWTLLNSDKNGLLTIDSERHYKSLFQFIQLGNVRNCHQPAEKGVRVSFG